MQKPCFLRDDQSARCSFTACGISIDISRQRLTQRDLSHLYGMAEEKKMLTDFRKMCEGNVVNESESRKALHTLLRANTSLLPEFSLVSEEKKRSMKFARDVREGCWRGAKGEKITDVINVGIGGSEKGPHALYHALRHSKQEINLHFLSTVDGILLDRILERCNPYTTLIVVSSKSFTTRETQINAAAVDQWLLEAGISGKAREQHMVVVSANVDAAKTMCLPSENQFLMWDWIGGRFSVWGSVGLPVAIALGPEVFEEFLMGAHEMDVHTLSSPIQENLAIHLALLSYWNADRYEMMNHCVLPYDERLRAFVPWLQQLEMESLGKSYHPGGEPVLGKTGQSIWGGNGNEAQHSFYQWLREGTTNSSIDLFWVETPEHRHAEHFRVLLANARAQADALVIRPQEQPYFNALTTIVLDYLSPRRLGALMALYEHKTTMLGTLYKLNPYDQPGVELGKKLSKVAEAHSKN